AREAADRRAVWARAWPARPNGAAPGRARLELRHRRQQRRLRGPRLGLHSPVDDQPEVDDRDLQDEHHEDELPDHRRGSVRDSLSTLPGRRLATAERERAGNANLQRPVRQNSFAVRSEADQELDVVLPASVRSDPEPSYWMQRRTLVRRRI